MKKLLIIPSIFISCLSMSQCCSERDFILYPDHLGSPKKEKVIEHNRVEFGEVFLSNNKIRISWTLWYACNTPGTRIVNDMDVYRDIPLDKVRQFEDSIRIDADKKFQFLDSLRK